MLFRTPKLTRLISASYPDPFTGEPSHIDPNNCKNPGERDLRKIAIKNHLPHTGYAKSLEEEDQKANPGRRP